MWLRLLRPARGSSKTLLVELFHVEDYYSVLDARSKQQLVVAPAHLAKFKIKARLRAHVRGHRSANAAAHFAAQRETWWLLELPQQTHGLLLHLPDTKQVLAATRYQSVVRAEGKALHTSILLVRCKLHHQRSLVRIPNCDLSILTPSCQQDRTRLVSRAATVGPLDEVDPVAELIKDMSGLLGLSAPDANSIIGAAACEELSRGVPLYLFNFLRVAARPYLDWPAG